MSKQMNCDATFHCSHHSLNPFNSRICQCEDYSSSNSIGGGCFGREGLSLKEYIQYQDKVRVSLIKRLTAVPIDGLVGMEVAWKKKKGIVFRNYICFKPQGTVKFVFGIWQGRNGRPWQLVLLHRNSLGVVVATLVTVRDWFRSCIM